MSVVSDLVDNVKLGLQQEAAGAACAALGTELDTSAISMDNVSSLVGSESTAAATQAGDWAANASDPVSEMDAATNTLNAARSDPAGFGIDTLEAVASNAGLGGAVGGAVTCTKFESIVGSQVAELLGTGAIEDPLEALSQMSAEAIAEAYAAAEASFDAFLDGLGPIADMLKPMISGLSVLDQFDVGIEIPKIGDIAECLAGMACGSSLDTTTNAIQIELMNDMNVTNEGKINLDGSVDPLYSENVGAIAALAQEVKDEMIPSPLPTPDIAIVAAPFTPWV